MKTLLAVTGSIAAYKSYDVARGLVKKGHQVRVVLTRGALEFIKPETFRYLGVDQVYLPDEDFNPKKLSENATVLHVELAKWADKLVVAPMSANTLSRLSLGLNNDLLGSIYLAFGKKPILLFPAMNTQMWEHPKIQGQVSSLCQIPHVGLIQPTSGILACGDIGAGKFPEVSAVIDLIETFDPTQKIKGKVIITAGATAAPIDPVRYVSNPSSGKMGMAIAKEFLKNGHQVLVLAGHACTPEIENLKGHPQFQMLQTATTEKMKEAAIKHFPESVLYISTGAIADIEFDVNPEKLKKEGMGNTLQFHQAADILKHILTIKKSNQKIISFAAETNTTEEVFNEKMQRKPVDLMIGNRVANGLIDGIEMKGFQREDGEYWFVFPQKIQGPQKLSKAELASKIYHWYQGQS